MPLSETRVESRIHQQSELPAVRPFAPRDEPFALLLSFLLDEMCVFREEEEQDDGDDRRMRVRRDSGNE